ncbi:integrase [Tanacetum coccineum]
MVADPTISAESPPVADHFISFRSGPLKPHIFDKKFDLIQGNDITRGRVRPPLDHYGVLLSWSAAASVLWEMKYSGMFLSALVVYGLSALMGGPMYLSLDSKEELPVITNIISQLGSAFALEDLGPLNYFLDIEIVPHVSGILLSQKKYILELLKSVGLSNCNPVSSLMVTSSSLSLDDSTAFSNPVKYRQVVGSLQYITLSRPNIAFAVNKVISILLLKLSQMLTKQGIQTIDEAEYKALADTIVELTWL